MGHRAAILPCDVDVDVMDAVLPADADAEAVELFAYECAAWSGMLHLYAGRADDPRLLRVQKILRRCGAREDAVDALILPPKGPPA